MCEIVNAVGINKLKLKKKFFVSRDYNIKKTKKPFLFERNISTKMNHQHKLNMDYIIFWSSLFAILVLSHETNGILTGTILYNNKFLENKIKQNAKNNFVKLTYMGTCTQSTFIIFSYSYAFVKRLDDKVL